MATYVARQPDWARWTSRWPLWIGLAAIVVPTFISLARQVWTSEDGIQGPIVLATGAWLIARDRAAIVAAARAGSLPLGLIALLFCLILWIVGRTFDFISVEVAGMMGALFTVAYMNVGADALRKLWFPVLYLLFLIPPPGSIVDRATAPLKEFVSWAATGILSHAGYPIVRQGVTLYVAQYQLLVEDACSGLRSLVSLVAISLFYIYLLHNASWRYALALMLWIVPIAIAANIVRIILLVLITYHWGDAAAQGFLHATAGMVMFVFALLGIVAIDWLMQAVITRARR
ncbi:MAG: exosortase V [Sphingomonadaceae bacterium]|nr:exosortase V [Sphingomonadaceae bacterium]